MSVRTACGRVVSTGCLEDVEMDAALECWRGGDGCFWMRLDTDAPSEVTSWLRARDLPFSGLKRFLEPSHGAKFQVLDEAVVFQLPTAAEDESGEAAGTTFVCLDRLLIQIRRCPPSSDAIESHTPAWRYTKLPEVSTSGLVCALLILHSASLLAVAVKLRADARRLSAQVDDDAASVPLNEIMTLKGRIRDLDEANDDQLAVLTALKLIRRPELDLVRIADFFQVAITNAESCDRAVDRLTAQAGDLKSNFDAFQHSKLNRRLALLTIVSTIFLPLTLLAGIYGMNFDVMPELHLPIGYPVVLIVMAITAAGLLWYFWSRGWFTDL